MALPLPSSDSVVRSTDLSSSAGPRPVVPERGRHSLGGRAAAARHSTSVSIGSLLEPDRVFGSLAAGNKTELLRLLAQRAASVLAADGDFLFDLLMAREQLGSTATGHGYALPHTEWKGLTTFFGMFARLARPIDFGGLDGRRVDLVFLLLSPTDAGRDHLATLAAIARQLRSPAVAAKLRGTRDTQRLYQVLTASPEIIAL